MEQWDILDKNGNPTGRTVARRNVRLAHGEYHLVVHIWVVGSDGRVLIQRRSDDKPLMPGEWAATGGAAISGEDSLTAAHRELKEELGLDVPTEKLLLIKRIMRKNSFLDIYLVHHDANIEDLHLQKEEVACAEWVHRNKLMSMVRKGEYHNYGKEYFNTLFAGFRKYKRSPRKEQRHE
ncbi:MAG: NUDIX domain-containing protein [Clostridia bacterium]|nr:NUDIX domain-containing protein [Clostridia bacterium]